MSTVETGARQHDRLCARGSIPALLPELLDVDSYDDARRVARDIPHSRFAKTFADVRAEIAIDESQDAA